MARFRFSIFLFVGILLLACTGSPSKTRQKQLCPRNEFSQNGVKKVTVCEYNASNGIINEDSRTILYTQEYDSLGNVVSIKKGMSIPDDLVHINSVIESARINKEGGSLFQFEYKDTVLAKILVFDADGTYRVRVEHFESPAQSIDSIYFNNYLEAVDVTIFDASGRDSLGLAYNRKHSRGVELDSKTEYTYQTLDDGTKRVEYVMRWKGDDFSRTQKFAETISHHDEVYDDSGRLIKTLTNGRNSSGVFTYSYDDANHITKKEYKGKSYLGTFNISQIYEYTPTGLLKSESTISDGSVLTRQIRYEYEFYPYSPTTE